jgi:hypothetical protein
MLVQRVLVFVFVFFDVVIIIHWNRRYLRLPAAAHSI